MAQDHGGMKHIESLLDRVFPDGMNPLYHLGGLSYYFFWILTFTGLYLFVFFETSLNGAYLSMEAITHEQYYIGGIMRSIHRYASAAMAVTVTLHLIKELSMKRFHGPRMFSWFSGVPLLWLLFASGIGGYWLVWDDRAQYVAQTTARLFDALPIVVEPMAFGFMRHEVVSDRFFSLLIFLHIGIPLALLLGMFIHIQRISQSKSLPPKKMSMVVLAALTILSIISPATSGPPADLNQPLQEVQLDWFYMNFFPQVEAAGPFVTWVLLLGVTGLLLILPILVREPEVPIARVDPDYCNGCGWCFADCPYDAIYMKPHDFRPNHRQSVVVADKCVGCGICAGACPTATPFKTVNKSFSGINLTDLSNSAILENIVGLVNRLESDRRILVVGCDHGADINSLAAPDVAVLQLACIGQLPPSYMDFLCRKESVDSIVLTGCAAGDCFHRLGNKIQDLRLAHEREPHLRFKDVKPRVSTVWAAGDMLSHLRRKIDQLRQANDHAA